MLIMIYGDDSVGYQISIIIECHHLSVIRFCMLLLLSLSELLTHVSVARWMPLRIPMLIFHFGKVIAMVQKM